MEPTINFLLDRAFRKEGGRGAAVAGPLDEPESIILAVGSQHVVLEMPPQVA